MSSPARIALFVGLAVLLLGAAGVYALRARDRYVEQHATEPTVPVAASTATLDDGPRIVFRHTGLDNHYGLVATVPLDDPSGARTFTDVPCDRVDADEDGASCLVTERGVVTKFSNVVYDADWQERATLPLAGIPSRTRLSPDGSLVASTVFVTGHSYMQTGFSTVTTVRSTGDGPNYGNLEHFTLDIGGKVVAPVDRNVWGVTFADDDRTFYATVGTGGQTYLVHGDLQERTLTALTENAECPSLSPDETKVAFKIDVDPGDQKRWGLAVYDLATGKRTALTNGPEPVDDQVEWLDDDTLLYGQPREDEAGVTDVWEVDTYPAAEPRLLIQEAWSPAVVSAGATGESR